MLAIVEFRARGNQWARFGLAVDEAFIARHQIGPDLFGSAENFVLGRAGVLRRLGASVDLWLGRAAFVLLALCLAILEDLR